MTTPAGPPLLAYADGANSPRSAPAVVAAAGGVGDVEVLLGWTPEERSWLAWPSLRGRTVMAGYALATDQTNLNRPVIASVIATHHRSDTAF